MTVGEIQKIFERWAPKEIAWEKDNVGLQIGDKDRKVNKIFIALDLTEKVIKKAISKKVDLIISHHPLIFKPISAITANGGREFIVKQLIKNDISLLVAHTNLDFTKFGVSYFLAERLNLKNVDILVKDFKVHRKIVVFVPKDYVDKVVAAMSQAGAGRIGKYEMCSFQTSGIGTFKSANDSKPFIGKAGKFEKVNEVRLEMVVPLWKLREVILAMKSVHPYEEVAYDVYNMENLSDEYGSGIFGECEKQVTLREFLEKICKALKVPCVRYLGNLRSKVKRVAMCGGSGIDLLPAAIRKKADVFVTADISYHRFQEMTDEIAIVDAGHFETEFPIVKNIATELAKHFAKLKEKITIYTSSCEDNPIKYYIR